MWIIEDDIYGEWTKLSGFKTEQEAQVTLARFVLDSYYSKYQFRIIYKPNN